MKIGRIYFFIPFLIILAQTFAKTKLKCYTQDEDVISCKNNVCDVGYCVEIGAHASNCCKETHCPETGLFSFPELFLRYNLVKWDESYDNNTWYKNKQMFNGKEEDLACLIPKSFELLTTASKFKKTIKKTPRCDKSDDCDLDEFCGSVVNPSFCPEKKDCLDQSNNGTSLMFCFKLPNVTNKMLLAGRKEVGLPACNTNEDCKVELPTEDTSCEDSEISIRRIEDGVIKTYQKICAKKFEDEAAVLVAESCWLIPIAVSGAIMFLILLLTCAAIFYAHIVFKKKLEKESKDAIAAAVKNAMIEKAKTISNKKKELEKMDSTIKQKDILIEYMEKKEKAKS